MSHLSSVLSLVMGWLRPAGMLVIGVLLIFDAVVNRFGWIG